MKRLFALVVALIVYGSLLPWHFQYRELPEGPIWYLLHRWDARAGPYLIHDVAINIAIYIPLGVAAHFVMESSFAPILFAAALATAMELAQIYVPTREAAIIDILADAAGAAVGASIAVFLRSVPSFWARWHVPRAVAWIFLAAIAAFRLASLRFVPVTGTFIWVPFQSYEIHQQAELLAVGIKALAYTGAIGFFRLSGMFPWKAAAIVTTAVALIEIIRLFAPYTDSGITDPVIAVIGGFVVSAWYPKKDAI
jgi:VanZ family protein